MQTPPDDPLSALSERVRSAQAAAERLAEEANRVRAADAASEPAGEGVPRAGEGATAEVQALATLLQAVRGLVPDELWAQVTELLRQLLVLVRAILDWWIERLGHAAGAAAGTASAAAPGPRIEDIPIR